MHRHDTIAFRSTRKLLLPQLLIHCFGCMHICCYEERCICIPSSACIFCVGSYLYSSIGSYAFRPCRSMSWQGYTQSSCLVVKRQIRPPRGPWWGHSVCQRNIYTWTMIMKHTEWCRFSLLIQCFGCMHICCYEDRCICISSSSCIFCVGSYLYSSIGSSSVLFL